MNTIFKLYFQGWVLLSIGGAWGILGLWRQLGRPLGYAWLGIVGMLAAAAMVYPLAATWDRTGGFGHVTFRSQGLTPWAAGLSLDGLRYWEQVYPEDLAAVRWLRGAASPGDHILEATGGGYSHTGRISMATGLPTVLGADGHEHQWRGSRELIDPRKAEVEAFFSGSLDENQMAAMLDGYDVRFVIVGGYEYSQHGVPAEVLDGLSRVAAVVFEQGQTRIYERSRMAR